MNRELMMLINIPEELAKDFRVFTVIRGGAVIDEWPADADDIKMTDNYIDFRCSQIDDGWIPVDDKLPPEDLMVLVTCKSKKGVRSVNRAYRTGDFWHGSGSMSGVTAWMWLPEPYKED